MSGADSGVVAPMVRIESIPVRLAVEVGATSLTVARVFELAPGGVIVLDRQVDEPLDVRVNGTLIARGEIVSIDGRYGVRIVELAEPDGFQSGERRS